MTELSAIVDKFGVYIYKNPLIYFRVETFSNWKHRELVVKRDNIANSYICKLDEEIFTELPVFTPEILKDDILNEWIDECWTDLMIAMFNAARTHKWCVVKLYDRAPYWRVFTWRHMKEIKYNKYDVPVSANMEWSATLDGSTENPSTHKEQCNFNYNDEKTGDFDSIFVKFGAPHGKEVAVSDLEAIWDLIVYIRYQALDIVNNSAKTSGFFHLIYGDAIKESQRSDLKNAFDYTGVGQAIGAKERVLKDIKFHTPDHPEFTIEAMDEMLNLLSGATRLPLSFFKGEKQGGGVFQEGFSDEAKITKKKKYVFGQFKKYIIQLVRMRWGKEIENVEPYIEEEIEQAEGFEQQAEKQFQSDHFKKEQKPKVKKIA
jgi:hypothetical protein